MKDENAIEGLVGALFGRVKISGRTKGSEYRVGHIDELCHQAASQLLAMKAENAAMKGVLEEVRAARVRSADYEGEAWSITALNKALPLIDALISPNAGGGDA